MKDHQNHPQDHQNHLQDHQNHPNKQPGAPSGGLLICMVRKPLKPNLAVLGVVLVVPELPPNLLLRRSL